MSDSKLPGNLVALVYAPNSCYCQVIDTCPSGLVVDPKQKTWIFNHPGGDFFQNKQTSPIGKCNFSMQNKSSGVIGVYDRTDIAHLDSMVSDWQKMNRHESYLDD